MYVTVLSPLLYLLIFMLRSSPKQKLLLHINNTQVRHHQPHLINKVHTSCVLCQQPHGKAHHHPPPVINLILSGPPKHLRISNCLLQRLLPQVRLHRLCLLSLILHCHRRRRRVCTRCTIATAAGMARGHQDTPTCTHDHTGVGWTSPQIHSPPCYSFSSNYTCNMCVSLNRYGYTN